MLIIENSQIIRIVLKNTFIHSCVVKFAYFDEMRNAHNAFKTEITEYITKPISQNDFTHHVKNVLTKNNLVREDK